jgi:hypothetical protein
LFHSDTTAEGEKAWGAGHGQKLKDQQLQVRRKVNIPFKPDKKI